MRKIFFRICVYTHTQTHSIWAKVLIFLLGLYCCCHGLVITFGWPTFSASIAFHRIFQLSWPRIQICKCAYVYRLTIHKSTTQSLSSFRFIHMEHETYKKPTTTKKERKNIHIPLFVAVKLDHLPACRWSTSSSSYFSLQSYYSTVI